MKRLFILTAAIGLAYAPASAFSANLLTNGGFELPALSGTDQDFAAPSSFITGWQVTSGSVDINHNSAVFGTADTGVQMLDINGMNSGTISQSFATVPDDSYLLSLAYANNPNTELAKPNYAAGVTLTGGTVLLSQFLQHGGSTPTQMNWIDFYAPFVANSLTTTLQLQSLTTGFNGVVFDSVSVGPVPEPSSVVLAVIAASALSVVAMRKQRAKRYN